MQVIIRTAFADNYIFLLTDDAGNGLVAVDPGDAEPVFKFLAGSGRRLTAILNTHHHRDHTGGNLQLAKAYPGVPIYGGAGDRGRIPGQTHFLEEGNAVVLPGVAGRVLDVPGHTRSHIAYYFANDHGEGDLFSGDTVFGGTIGNLFEGTPETMFKSIQKIRGLPCKTQIWAAHEYTLQYVRESAGLDPDNRRLRERLKRLEADAHFGRPTVPLDLQEECDTNPFFRWEDPVLTAHLGTAPGVETFRYLCEMT